MSNTPNRSELIVVDPKKRKSFPDIKELFRYKDLFVVLAWRDLRVRYAQTFLGLIWTLIQPLATLAIMVLIFQRALNVDTGDVPYVLFSFAGISAWTYFSFVFKESGNSIIGAGEMIKKIYFPRLVIPLSKAVVGLVDYAVTLLILGFLMIWFSYSPGPAILLLPLFIFMTIICSLTFGIWVSALTIRYRDLQHVVPFVVQFGLFATPVAYPTELVIQRIPKWASILYYLNPMAGVVDGFRWCLFGGSPPHELAYVSYLVIAIMFIGSLYYFKRTERIMADVI